jgi:hypothetical protein
MSSDIKGNYLVVMTSRKVQRACRSAVPAGLAGDSAPDRLVSVYSRSTSWSQLNGLTS